MAEGRQLQVGDDESPVWMLLPGLGQLQGDPAGDDGAALPDDGRPVRRGDGAHRQRHRTQAQQALATVGTNSLSADIKIISEVKLVCHTKVIC